MIKKLYYFFGVMSLFIISIFVLSTKAIAQTTISSQADWNNLCSSSSVSGSYILGSDITVSDKNFIKNFSGTFNGNNKTITFNCNYATEYQNFGIFESVDGSGVTTIKNLKVVYNQNVSATGYFGGICAYVSTSLNIENCHVTFNNYYSSDKSLGGLVGYSSANTLTINKSSVNSNYNLTGETTGGFVGFAKNVNVIGSKATLYSLSSRGSYIGGIIGASSSENSILHKNYVNISYRMTYLSNSDNFGGGLLAGEYHGSASANYVYSKSLGDYLDNMYLLVGYSYQSTMKIYNNICITGSNISTTSKKIYRPTFLVQELGNYVRVSQSSLIYQITSIITVADQNTGYRYYNTTYFSGYVYAFLNYAINVGCGGTTYSGSGERYFKESTSEIAFDDTIGQSAYDKYVIHPVYFYHNSPNDQTTDVYAYVDGTQLIIPSSLSDNYYNFNGWAPYNSQTPISGVIKVTSSETYYALWNPKSKTITYKNDTATLESQTIWYNKEFTITDTIPTKENSIFLYWEIVIGENKYTYTKGNKVPVSVVNLMYEKSISTISAIFDTNSKNITVDLNGGSLNTSYNTTLLKNNSFYVTHNAPTKDDYRFTNWSVYDGETLYKYLNKDDVLSEDEVNELILSSNEITFKANYESANTLIPIIDLDGGEFSTPYNPKLNKNTSFTITSQTPTKSGNSFDYWTIYMGETIYKTLYKGQSLTATEVNELISSGNQITFKANYEKTSNIVSRSVKYDFDGGDMGDVSYNTWFYRNNEYTLPLSGPIKEGYEFKEWVLYINDIPSKVFSCGDVINKDTVISYVESGNSYKFKATYNTLSAHKDIIVDYDSGNELIYDPVLIWNEDFYIPNIVPTKDNYTFKNWELYVGDEKLFNLYNYQFLDKNYVNTLISLDDDIKIKAIYEENDNKFYIRFSSEYYMSSINISSFDFDICYGTNCYLPEINMDDYYHAFSYYYYTIDGVKYYAFEHDLLQWIKLEKLVDDGIRYLEIYVEYQYITQYETIYSFDSDENIFNIENPDMVIVYRRFANNVYTRGYSLKEGTVLNYYSDGFYTMEISTTTINSQIIVNGVKLSTSNGKFFITLNYGDNEIITNCDMVIVAAGINVIPTNVDIICQYDTVNPQNATKIRFIAQIAAVEDVSAIKSITFSMGVNGANIKEFEVTKLYKSISSLYGKGEAKIGTYYAIYTITDIEDAIKNNTSMTDIMVKVELENSNTLMSYHYSFRLGSSGEE